MNDKPLVSITIPFLNAEKFIEGAIQSIFAQTYENWELLLVDDGSTDHSTQIALDYAEKYPGKVFYFEHDQHKNRGLSATRNLGIQHAKGKYIALLDSDDVWLPFKLEEQVEILELIPEAAMVYGASEYWYSWTNRPEDIDRDYIEESGIDAPGLIQPPKLLTLALESKAPTPCPSDILLRKEILEHVGGFEESFDSFRAMFEDQAFLAKIYLSAPVYVSNQCWDRYRQHRGSIVHKVNKAGKNHKAGLFYLTWLEEYFLRQGIKDDELWKALRIKQESYKNKKLRYSNPNLSRIITFTQTVQSTAKRILKRSSHYLLPNKMFYFLLSKWKGYRYLPPTDGVRFGDLRRLKPISEHWGSDRGLPIDRYYIESFLASHSEYMKGRVLEFGDDRYTRKFGTENIIQSDIINLLKESNPDTTIVADITSAPHIPSDSFDCIIFTQTLQLIYDFRAAIQTLYRILKPGGILLATFPGISQSSGTTWDRYWCWNFTYLSAERLFKEFFPDNNVEVKAHGNLLTAISFLQGLAREELSIDELEYHDPRYEMVITVKAVKPEQV
ncbi:MAG: glycosyltransferase [Deltaproteobacteria bacterium]